jgi:N6-L-threonylcarbamoyladenine synthase
MSFSGLKTAVVNIAHNAQQKGIEIDRSGLAASFAAAISDTLVPRTMAAARELNYKNIAVAGGVAANSRVRADFEAAAEKEGKRLFVPPIRLCGDNGAMIGCQGYYEFLAGTRAGQELNAYATMDIDKFIPDRL